MDAKDLRTVSGVSERNNDGTKYASSSGSVLHCDSNKSYQDIGSNPLVKMDGPNARPCAIIGPDRVVPPPAASDGYLRKAPAEPWLCMDNTYRRPPDYPHKLHDFQNPTRNISPRQTFQENMQRIMVPPTYSSVKSNVDSANIQLPDRSNAHSKNIKINTPPEAKFCDVPYTVNPTSNEQKSRNSDMCLQSVNPTLSRTASHGWPPGSVNLRPTKSYGAPELYQYPEYPSCAGPRPVVPRPHRPAPEEPGYVYPDPYYQEGNIRFKPYPNSKERYPQQRYDYVGNYSSPFHPPPSFPSHKYDVQKAIPSQAYPSYPPNKYLDSRITEPIEGYPRNPQGNYNMSYRNQIIHPNYGPIIGNCAQNKMHSYPHDAHIKNIPPNKLPYDNNINNPKAYIEYENARHKIYPPTESYFVNEMTRMQPMKSQVIMPNYSAMNMHNIPPPHYYKKDNQQIKNLEYMTHYRNIDPSMNIYNHISRHPSLFSPTTLAISPTDSNTSNDNTQSLTTSQEDCGYVSQSSTASVRSIDSGFNRVPHDYLRKYQENRYGLAPAVRTPYMMQTKAEFHSNNNSKDKKTIDVRQFLQMWNEGEDETDEKNPKEIILQTNGKNNFGKTHEPMNNQEQLYVLGLVNVPSDELAKYEHIQKVSKLPENIKGYNNIELLTQFEEAIESSNINHYKSQTAQDFQKPFKAMPSNTMVGVLPQRPVSPLDVEAKISQSVIHKEVGCNFEIKPCSPKMLSVEMAAPVQNILAERSIEKVVNPVLTKSPMLNAIDDKIESNIIKRQDHRLNMNENGRNPSCKMNTQYQNNDNIDPLKNSYSIQDLESNSGLCLASLPRLDNDIELNFPEVNQQFINANKGDSGDLTSLSNLPQLEIPDLPDTEAKDNFIEVSSSRQETDFNPSKIPSDTEKEFPKLSKYRKTKTLIPDHKENMVQHNVNTVRTDSVIIKNPENVKNYEDNFDITNSLNKSIEKVQDIPINLTSQGNIENNILDFDTPKVPLDNYNEKEAPIDTAIDFSLNKSSKPDTNNLTLINVEPTSHSNEDKCFDVYIDKYKRKHSIFTDQVENSEDNTCSPSYETMIDSTCATLVGNENSAIVATDTNHSSPADDNGSTNINDNDCASLISEGDYTSLVDDNNKTYENLDSAKIIKLKESFTDVKSEQANINMSKKSPVNSLSGLTNCEYDCEFENESLMETDEGDESCINETTTRNQSYEAFSHTQGGRKTTNTDQKDKFQMNKTYTENICDNNSNLRSVAIKGVNERETAKNDNNLVPNINEITNMELDAGIPSTSEVLNATQLQETRCPSSNILPNESAMFNSKDETKSIHTKFLFEKLDCDTKTTSNTKEINSKVTSELSSQEEFVEIHQRDLHISDMPTAHMIYHHENENTVFNRTYRRYLYYGSKEMYTPRIQNLIIFTEGVCVNTINRNDISEQISANHTTVSNIDAVNDGVPCSHSTIIEDSRVFHQEYINNDIHKGCEEVSLNTEPNVKGICNGSLGEHEIGGLCNSKCSVNSPKLISSNIKVEIRNVENPNDAPNAHKINDESFCKEEAEGSCNSLGSQETTSLIPILINTEETEPLKCSDRIFCTAETKHPCDTSVCEKSHDIDSSNVNKNDTLLTEETKYHCDDSVNDNSVCEKSRDMDSSNVDKNARLLCTEEMNPCEKRKDPCDNSVGRKSHEIDSVNSAKLFYTENTKEQWDNSVDEKNHDIDFIKDNSIISKSENDEPLKRGSQIHKISDGAMSEKISDNKVYVNMPGKIDYTNTKVTKNGDYSEKKRQHKNDVSDEEFCIKESGDSCDSLLHEKNLELNSIRNDEYIVQNEIQINNGMSVETFFKDKIYTCCGSRDRLDNEIDPKLYSNNIINYKRESKNEERILDKNEPITKHVSDADVFKEITGGLSETQVDGKTLSFQLYNYPDVPDLDDDGPLPKKELDDDLCETKMDEKKLDLKLNNCIDVPVINEQSPKEELDTNKRSDEELSKQVTDNSLIDEKYLELNSNNMDKIISEPESEQCLHNKQADENESPHLTGNNLESLVSEKSPSHDLATSSRTDVTSIEISEKMTKNNASMIEDAENSLNTEKILENTCNTDSKIQHSDVKPEYKSKLKRSLSDSAINLYNNNKKQQDDENVQYAWPLKRRKVNNVEDEILAQNICNIIQNNRRNSVSSFYTEDNVSFCIVIDNSCIITEEESGEQEKICYTELSEDCLTELQNEDCLKNGENSIESILADFSSPHKNICENSDSFSLEYEEEKAMEESWVEDVACVETVISDYIAEDIEINQIPSPINDSTSDNDESGVFSTSEHTDKVKFIYGDKMCNDDAQFVETLFNTPQMDVNKTLNIRELSQSCVSETSDKYYDNDSLEKMLSESNAPYVSPYIPKYMDPIFTSVTPNTNENRITETLSTFKIDDVRHDPLDTDLDPNVEDSESIGLQQYLDKTQDDTVHSCESSIDNVFTYKQKGESLCSTSSSSPEVSSTTSEEKNSSILLKITNYKGSRISKINDISRTNKTSCCKFTEEQDYLQSHSNFPKSRPLLTKAAQKYIPPLKESIRDLKVKLSLPQHSLMKLKQLKLSKDKPKIKQSTAMPRIPKKPKPKFEDVLKSIDEIHFKMHKEKSKKVKKSIPKVVIKKNRNGSHYASTSEKNEFNPDLTGRKWQPWVFIEKNHFIDKMAIKKKTQAIYSHRKKTYVLAEKFQKYKSASNGKFVISPPISTQPCTGLKYTIRLKHY